MLVYVWVCHGGRVSTVITAALFVVPFYLDIFVFGCYLIYFPHIIIPDSCPVLGQFFFSLLNILKPTGHVMHHQFNIQQLYALPTLYLCVLCLSENRQRLVPLTA